MNKEQNKEMTDQQFYSILAFFGVLLAAGLFKKIKPWLIGHWFLLAIIGAACAYALIEFLRYRWKVKNPEKYQRKIAIQIMGNNADAIVVGQTLKDKKPLSLTTEQRSAHVQIVGATGRGKTQSIILPWFIQDLRLGNSPILIDGKGDQALITQIQAYISKNGYWGDFRIFDLNNPKGSCTINPLEGGSPQEVADRLIASLEFESSYFRDIQHQALLVLFELMEQALWPYTFQGIYLALTDPLVLSDLIKASGNLTPSLKAEALRLQTMSVKDKEERYSGLISQIRPFATGDLLHLVNGRASQKAYLSLTEILRRKSSECPQASVILLNTMRHQKTAKVLGKVILQTLAWATSHRTGQERFSPIFLDEFSAFVYDGFEQFLNKSRSYKVGLHLSHQSIGDFEKISPSFMKTLNVNTNVKCLLGLNDPDTADYFAKHIGTRQTVKTTERGKTKFFGGPERTGDLSLRNVDEYKIHPNRLRNYSRGVGVLSLLVNGIPLTEEIQFQAEPGGVA